MSSETQNTGQIEQKKQPRLYKRGNDDIDLDEYIRTAEAEFDIWLADSRLKDKQKKEVRDAYRQLLQGISEGNVTYKIGGGYDNSIGINNATKGFDAAGLAAGFLGNVLRNQAVYTQPTNTDIIDSSKTKYEGAKTIGTRGLQQLLGEAGNIQYFINQDDLVDGKRGHTNRIKLIQDYLNDIAAEGNWDKYFTGYTSEQKDQWFKDYEKYGKNIDLNQNGLIDENEYLGLSRLLGLNNIEQLLFTGQAYKVAPQTEKVYTNENEYRSEKHPKSTQTLAQPRIIQSDKHNYPQQLRTLIVNKLANKNEQQLLNIIKQSLSTPLNGQVATNIPEIPYVTNNYILSTSLEIARRNGFLHQFQEGSNQFYIPIESSDLTGKSSGLVYQISQDGKHQILEMDRNDIPYFTNQWHQDFMNQIPSNKNGGVLKFDGGGKTGILSFNQNRNNIYFTGDFGTYDNWHARNIILPWLTAYQDAKSTDWEDLIKKGLNSWNDAGGFDWYNATDEQRKHGMQSAGTQAHQQYVIDYLPGLNTEIAKHMSNYNVPVGANTNDRFIDGVLKGTDTDFGIQTGNRRPTIHIKSSGQELMDWDNFYRNLGYIGRYKYLDHWVPTKENKNQDGLVLFTQDLNQSDTDEPYDGSDFIENQTITTDNPADTYKKVFGDTVDEDTLPNGTSKKNISDFIQNLGPDLLGAGRLWASLRTNNKVYNTIRPSLKPVLKNTYERFSPVTGNFQMMQLKNRQAAQGLFQANQPFTSDASLTAARMHEGQKWANQLQTEGFLVDDQEIRRTRAEALARIEDNMARRSENANFDNASINQTNREIAQLGATRLKSNWQSWDNYLQGIETRLRTKFDSDRERANSFYDKLATYQAEKWYNDATEKARNAYNAYITANPTTDPSVGWNRYKDYVKFMREARNRANSMIYSDMASRYNLNYYNPYTDESNTLFRWRYE